MQEQLNPNKFSIIWNKIQPVFVRVFNGIVYFIVGIVKTVFKTAMDQFKGKM